ncbi:MAG: hypothetical protein KGJ42_04275, partial [Acidobacteriota bacterium]|nr:hypothetical protein [Acidobacteriota bacterium]
QVVTPNIVWVPSYTSSGKFFWAGFLRVSVTIAVVVLAIGMAALIRRSEFTTSASRVGRIATKLLTLSQVLFLMSFAGWELVGGYAGAWIAPFPQLEKELFVVIVFIAIMSVMTSINLRSRHSFANKVGSSDSTL